MITGKIAMGVVAVIGATLSCSVHGQTSHADKKDRAEATAAVEAAVPKAQRDPTRPVYHFRPPAQWMNDICGAIHYQGYYHVFYQYNPFSGDHWGEKYSLWAHARSGDLVHWEDLPWALLPRKDRGERRCNSGCVALDGHGRPMIFYTFVPADATAFGLRVRCGQDGRHAVTLRCADGVLNVAGTEAPVVLGEDTKTVKLHVFLDRSVMEVFINDGRVSVTRVDYPAEEDQGVAVFSENGRATLKSLDLWHMRPIWQPEQNGK